MDKDFLFETNKHNDLTSRAQASGSDHQDTDTPDFDAPTRQSPKPPLAMVEFGSGWYHAAAVKHALKA